VIHAIDSTLNFILWNWNRDLFSIGAFALRWNVLMVILAYVVSRGILVYMYKKEGRPVRDAVVLLTCLIIAALIGARLGYVTLYERDLITSSPAEIFLPFKFQPKFSFAGSEGLSIAGGFIGVLLGVWLYCRINRQSFLPIMDRVSIMALVTASLLFCGSFLNNEPVGRPTNSASGTVFANPVTRGVSKIPCCIMRNPGGKNPLKFARAIKDQNTSVAYDSAGHQALVLYLFFSSGATEQSVNEFLIGDVKTFLFDMSEFVYEPGDEPLHYTIFVERDGHYAARVRTIGIARYPVQIFEAAFCAVVFIFVVGYWRKHHASLPPGRFFCASMVIFWTSRFAFAFMKEPEVYSEPVLGLSPDQILSIVFVIVSVWLWIRLARNKKGEAASGN